MKNKIRKKRNLYKFILLEKVDKKPKYKRKKKNLNIQILKTLIFLFFILFLSILIFKVIIKIISKNKNLIKNNNSNDSNIEYLLRKNNITKEDRVLVYTCCDELYSHFIPIFCNTLLRSDKLKMIDIEIGVNVNSLSKNEEHALDFLRKKYSYSKIKINYNIFIKNKTGIFYKNIKLHANSVRFVSEPTIKNKYVYITDVDIFIFTDNYFINLIDDMKRKNNKYSNLVRPNRKQLTGLHFTEYDAYYPVPKQEKYDICDEVLLFNIVKSKGIKIDMHTQYRPNPGIHASPSRPHVNSIGYVGWLAELYKVSWINYCRSDDFKYIYPLLDNYIIKQISKLNDYYGISEKDFRDIINTRL